MAEKKPLVRPVVEEVAGGIFRVSFVDESGKPVDARVLGAAYDAEGRFFNIAVLVKRKGKEQLIIVSVG